MLPWGKSVLLVQPSGGEIRHSFDINSLFSPDALVPLHQPLGRDQLDVFYEEYIVYKVDYVVQLTNQSGFSTTVSLVTNSETGVGITVSDRLEQPMTRYFQIGAAGGGSGTVTRTGTIHLHRVAGLPFRDYMGENAYSAPMSASPGEVLRFHVSVDGRAGGALGIINVLMTIKFRFHARLNELKIIPGS